MAPGERQIVDAFRDFLWSEQAQRIFVQYGFRSVHEPLNAGNPEFGHIPDLFTIADFGGWSTPRRTSWTGSGRSRCSATSRNEFDAARTTRRLESPVIPVAMLVLVLLPLLLLPLAAVFIFAFRGGPGAFLARAQDAGRTVCSALQHRHRVRDGGNQRGPRHVRGLRAQQVPVRGKRPLGIVVNLPVAIPTVVVGTSLLLLWGPIGLLGRAWSRLDCSPCSRPPACSWRTCW